MARCQLLFPSCRTLVRGYRAGTAPIVIALLSVLAGPLVCDKAWMHVHGYSGFHWYYGWMEQDPWLGVFLLPGCRHSSSTKCCTVFRLKLLSDFSTVFQWQAACFQIL